MTATTSPSIPNTPATQRAMRYSFTGQVQGVGFRPFVYRLAMEHGIAGWVENRVGTVVIHAEGMSENLHRFKQALTEQAPAAARPSLLQQQSTEFGHFQQFSIRKSATTSPSSFIHILTDLPLCESCRQELNDPRDRRFHYPFINCTQCGPRYTLIQALPYDRANTTMAEFGLCADCRREYETPTDRRFHAEPIACPACGPQLSYESANGEIRNTEQALLACMEDLRNGKLVAVKGIGGYHLLCDARNDEAVQGLRDRKQRPHKPLAVMMDESQLEAHVVVSADERQLLRSPAHPILLVNKKRLVKKKELLNQKPRSDLSTLIAPGLTEIGVILPYSPLHVLLIQMFDGPLVATSANISGEPVLTQRQDVTQRLGQVADAFLHHNRHIQRPADDPVYRIIHSKPRPLRLGRGNAPLELTLPFRVKQPLLAVGGHMKNTIALAWDDRVVISPHIGELDSLRGQQVFEQVIEDLQGLYRVQARQVVCDAHPGYGSSRWAQNSGLPVHRVFHHHAHAAGLCGEFPEHDHWLVFCWDGVGLGSDQSLWGGEALLGNCGHWQHAASFKTFHLPGGEKVGREPWRSAAALSWESAFEWESEQPQASLLHQAWKSKLNCPPCSSVGRLFDAAAALSGLNTHSSYEAQGPMLLEALANQSQSQNQNQSQSQHPNQTQHIALPLQQDMHGIWRSDWSPLLPMLTDNSLDIADRARCFHESLAQALLQQALVLRENDSRQTSGDMSKPFVVGLSGGVFQNRLLTERVMHLLESHDFRCYLPERVPINDAGLCYGQVMEYHAVTP